MRWKPGPGIEPKSGDTRVRHPFAWRKTPVEGWIVWLERYEVHETFFAPADGRPGWWSEIFRCLCRYA